VYCGDGACETARVKLRCVLGTRPLSSTDLLLRAAGYPHHSIADNAAAAADALSLQLGAFS